MAEGFVALYGAQNLTVVSNLRLFPTTPHDEPTVPPRQGPPVIGMLSNLTAEKGLYVFLSILESDKLAHCEFVLAGPAAIDDATAIRDALRRHRNFTYHGAIYGSEKQAMLRALDVFFFPTRYPNEAEPLVIWEAAQAGARIVSTARGCITTQLEAIGGVLWAEGTDAALAIRRALDLGRTEPIPSSTEVHAHELLGSRHLATARHA